MRVLPLPPRDFASLSLASSQLGHLGTNYLDGASLASVWQTVISTFLFDAIGGCVNTLCSQAYGAKNFKLVGIWLHIGMLVGTIACVPVGALYFVTEPVLRAFGFVANTDLAASFSRWSIIGIWPSVMYSLLNNYYQVRGLRAACGSVWRFPFELCLVSIFGCQRLHCAVVRDDVLLSF